jgi:hypothetical protein
VITDPCTAIDPRIATIARKVRLDSNARWVVAERHPERGRQVEADQQRQLERPDGTVPQQRDRRDQPDQGQRHADQVDDLVRAGHEDSIGRPGATVLVTNSGRLIRSGDGRRRGRSGNR